MIQSIVHLAMRRIALLAMSAAGVGAAFVGAPAAPPAIAPMLVPLVQVAPDDPAGTVATNPACTSPAPVHTSAFFHCYTPADIYAAYGVDAVHAAGLTGKGQTIVIVDSFGSPTVQQDLDFFSDTFGLPRTTIQIEHPNGTPSFNPTAFFGTEVGWAEETSLDTQWAHAIAPDAHIVLVEANPWETEGVQGFPSMFAGEEFAIQNFPGSVMSQSFAVTEQSFQGSSIFPQLAKFDQVYQDAIARKVTVFGSSGDSGTANVIDPLGSKLVPFPTVNWPSSDPLVTSAGGTWLQFGWTWNPTAANPLGFTTTPGSRTEAVWNESYLPAATGGGRSAIFSTPQFQSGISASVLAGRRGIPDLAWNAAVNGGVDVFTSFPGVRVGWHIIGGTSASSPQLAALTALASEKAGQPVGYLNPLLYKLPSGDFTDIVPQTFNGVTVANNMQAKSGIAGYPTTAGWDLTTGFGSPVALNYVTDLAAAVVAQH
jgi:subtilase family serine protease